MKTKEQVYTTAQFTDMLHGQPLPQSLRLRGSDPNGAVVVRADEAVPPYAQEKIAFPSVIFLQDPHLLLNRDGGEPPKSCYVLVFCHDTTDGNTSLIGIVGQVRYQDMAKDTFSLAMGIDDARADCQFCESKEFAYMLQKGKWAMSGIKGISDPVDLIPAF